MKGENAMKVDLFVREIAKIAFPDDLYSQTGFAFHLQIEFENFIKKFQLKHVDRRQAFTVFFVCRHILHTC